MKIRRHVEIDAPTDQVFEVIVDPDNDPRWCPTVHESRQVEGSGPNPGARYRQVHKPGPAKPTELEVELLEVERPRRVLLRSVDDLAIFHVEYRVEETSTGTRLTQIDDIAFRGVGRLLGPVMILAIRRGIHRQFGILRAQLEGSSRPG